MFEPRRDERKPALTIGRPRKDGKIPVEYCFFQSGKRIRKLLTQEQLKAEITAGRYTVA